MKLFEQLWNIPANYRKLSDEDLTETFKKYKAMIKFMVLLEIGIKPSQMDGEFTEEEIAELESLVAYMEENHGKAYTLDELVDRLIEGEAND